MSNYKDRSDGILTSLSEIVRRWRERKRSAFSGQEDGGIVLESALVLPMFLSFIVMLIAFIQISLAEMALQSAVSETTKVIAANMYPVDLLYRQAKSQWDQTAANGWIDQALSRIQTAKQTADTTEQFVEDYERWIPDIVVQLVGWEKTYRNHVEEMGQATTAEAKKKLEEAYKPLVHKAFTPIVALYSNKSRLKKERLKVTDVMLPDLNNKDNAFIGIEAQYEMPLAVPFFKKTVTIRKKAYERAWVGGKG